MIKKIKAYFGNRRMTKHWTIALGVLKGLDLALQNQGHGRQKRREYWRSFIAQHIIN